MLENPVTTRFETERYTKQKGSIPFARSRLKRPCNRRAFSFRVWLVSARVQATLAEKINLSPFRGGKWLGAGMPEKIEQKDKERLC